MVKVHSLYLLAAVFTSIKLMTLLGKVGKARLPTATLLLTLMLLKQTSTVGSMTPALEAHSAC